jgi:hypothetical protein
LHPDTRPAVSQANQDLRESLEAAGVSFGGADLIAVQSAITHYAFAIIELAEKKVLETLKRGQR